MNKTLKCYLLTSVNVIFSILFSNQLSQKINKDIKLVEDQTLLCQETTTHTQNAPTRNKNPEVSKKQDFQAILLLSHFNTLF